MGHVLFQVEVWSRRGQAGNTLQYRKHYICCIRACCIVRIKTARQRQGELLSLPPSPLLTCQTMVFTHLPSAIALALIAVPPTPLPSMALLLLRACTQSMDVAPRSAFLAEIISPEERTALMGIINMVKTASQSFGPLVTGALAGQRLFWVAFVMAGSLKATYDIGFLLVFAERKSSETEHSD